MRSDDSRHLPALPPHLAERCRVIGDLGAPIEDHGRFVLYWTHHAARAHENPAFDTATLIALSTGLPLLIYAGLGGRHPYNNDRHHTFMLEGLRDAQQQYAKLGHALRVHVPTDPGSPSPLASLARDAAVVVTEDFPAPPFPAWIDRLGTGSGTAIVAVDTACCVPMRRADRAFGRAFEFRKAMEKDFAAVVGARYPALSDRASDLDGALPFESLDLAQHDIDELVARCRIDHTIPAVRHTRGGSSAGYARWASFKADHLPAYHERRNDAGDLEGVSRMSPYLHHGMVSPMRLAREAHAAGHAGAAKFLDELFVWRELAHNLAFFRSSVLHALDALPKWARATLDAHRNDRRPALYSHERLMRARTGDTLWDLAQRSLLWQGELHNNARMTWAKMLPMWTESPERALQELIDLNHRFALDGSDPNSYGGLLWALGLFDRPFSPETAVLGTIRPRDTATHAKRLDMAAYRRVVSKRERQLRVCVIGAGVAGLAAARAIADQGHAVAVLEKARGPGGRAATRRAEPYTFDHGAQYFTVRDERVQHVLDAWLEAGVVAPYTPRLAEIDADGIHAKSAEGAERYIGVGGMNALAKHLASDVDVRASAKVSGLRHDDEQWNVTLDDGEKLGPFDAMVCTAPPAQATQLLSDVDTPLLADLRSIDMAPCWAAMLGFDRAIDTAFDAAFVNTGPLSWIARHHPAKPGRAPMEAWTVHASAAWSRENLERAPEDVLPGLIAEFRRLTGADDPPHTAAHRWRYALPTGDALPTECLWDAEHALALAGDWATGGRVEGAYLSGCAAAGRVLALA